MLYLKACPRCRGDIKFVNDIYGPVLKCLQCGFTVTSANREIIAAGAPEESATRHAARDPFFERSKVTAAS